jgi:hypothetical protein
MAGMQDFNRIRAGFSVAVIVGLAGVLVPATAAATDAYVNDSSGHSAAPCTLLNPCNSINTGISEATAGATVHVDGGTYNQAVTLGNGKSLIADDFAADGGAIVPTIDGGASSALSFTSDAGTIQGMILRSDGTSFDVVALDRVATLSGNTLSTTNPAIDADLVHAFGNAGGSTITGNTFNGSTTAGADQVGVESQGVPVTISGNTFMNTSVGVWAHGGGGTITGNHISGAHVASFSGDGIEVGPGAGQPTITGNTIDSPGSSTDGIAVEGSGPLPPLTGATIQRNRIIGGFFEGIVVEDSNGPVILDSNLITGATTFGIHLLDDSPTPTSTDGDVTATNMTVTGNATDISIASAALTIDSSIVQDPIQTGGTAESCSISFSSGPTTTSGGDGCMNFQTTATPDLGGSDGFHLLDTPNNRASFIDHGNPAGLAGSLDLDGLARRIDADGACPLSQVLDLGAYELQVAQPNCAPPPTSGGSSQPPVAQPRKCKKSKKRAAATQAKKKKCKRRK